MLADKIASVVRAMPSVSKVIVFDYAGKAGEVAAAVPHGITLAALTRGLLVKPVTFAQLPFDHPLYILYSSGTPESPNASFTATAASCSSIWWSMCSTPM